MNKEQANELIHEYAIDQGGRYGVLVPEENFRELAGAITERLKEGVVWEGDGWVFINGIVEFETSEHNQTDSDLLLPVEDGEGVWITVTKLPKVEEVEDG